MAPAVGILIARRLEKNFPVGHKVWSQGVVIGLATGAALSLLVARADFLLARAVRESARETCGKWRAGGRTLWFQGHWGFQYYMEKSGAMAIDLANPAVKIGDTFVVPANNTDFRPPKLDTAALRKTLPSPSPRLLTTWSLATGAGFYASVWGPLPFAFGRVPPEDVAVYALDRPRPRQPKIQSDHVGFPPPSGETRFKNRRAARHSSKQLSIARNERLHYKSGMKAFKQNGRMQANGFRTFAVLRPRLRRVFRLSSCSSCWR